MPYRDSSHRFSFFYNQHLLYHFHRHYFVHSSVPAFWLKEVPVSQSGNTVSFRMLLYYFTQLLVFLLDFMRWLHQQLKLGTLFIIYVCQPKFTTCCDKIIRRLPIHVRSSAPFLLNNRLS
jgi:hypothetical protein